MSPHNTDNHSYIIIIIAAAIYHHNSLVLIENANNSKFGWPNIDVNLPN